MELIVPDILQDVMQLSVILPVGGVLAGLILWLVGWRTHRFWVVLSLTVLGGIVGLKHAAELHTQPLLAALGVALLAGILALTLIRLLAFLAGGVAGLLLVNTLSPGWDQPFFAFVLGALAGLFLLRCWMMAMTSLAGVLLIAYGGLALAGQWTTLDAVDLCEAHPQLVNLVAGAAAAVGFVFQLGWDWFINRQPGGGKSAGKKVRTGKKDSKKDIDHSGLAA
jgi:hypothetical protein